MAHMSKWHDFDPNYPAVRRPPHICLVCFRPALVYNPRRDVRVEVSFTATQDGYAYQTRPIDIE
jgi:hypothetical protein